MSRVAAFYAPTAFVLSGHAPSPDTHRVQGNFDFAVR